MEERGGSQEHFSIYWIDYHADGSENLLVEFFNLYNSMNDLFAFHELYTPCVCLSSVICFDTFFFVFFFLIWRSWVCACVSCVLSALGVHVLPRRNTQGTAG